MKSATRLSILVFLLPSFWSVLQSEERNKATFHPKFFVFQTGFAQAKSKKADYLSELVQKAGFDGVELMGLNQVAEFIPELKKRNLKIFSLYLKIDLDAKQSYDKKLKSTLQQFQGEILNIWVHIHSNKHGRSDPAGDEKCVAVLQELADFTRELKVNIGIYHHTGFWCEKFSDGVRIAKKVKRANVGAVFNLCHYLRVTGSEHLEQELRNAFPYVMLVSINGADNGETQKMNWNRLIQPLGKGDFDPRIVLRILKEKGYQGAIGLQGFGIRQKPEEFFPSSVKVFQQYLKEIDQESWCGL